MTDQTNDLNISDEMRSAYETFEAGYPSTIPPCPEWCVIGEGHRYPSIDGDAYTRIHEEGPDSEPLYIEQEEFNRAGVITFGPLQIMDDKLNVYTAEQVRVRANNLTETALTYEAILAAQS
jgi:hypothetical protein